MVEFEADDALATAAARFAVEPAVEQVVICSPDKDLVQCVRGTRVVCLDRRRQIVLDEEGVKAKFGVPPESIPDWLALVGDGADGYPGLPRWGERSAAALLAHYRRLEDIPDFERGWAVSVRGAASLGQSLRERREEALPYRRLARLRTDVPLAETLDDLRWRGARRDAFSALCAEIGDGEAAARMPAWRDDAAAVGCTWQPRQPPENRNDRYTRQLRRPAAAPIPGNDVHRPRPAEGPGLHRTGHVQFFGSLGLPAVAAYATIAAELIGGVALVLGVRTRLVALALVPVMLGATWVHVGNGWLFSAPNGGWEYPAFLTVAAIVQALLGDGAYALANLRSARGVQLQPA